MNKIKRIFVDAHVFDHEFQGSRTYIKELYNELTKCQDLVFYFGAQDLHNLKKEIIVRENTHFVKYKTGASSLRLLFQLPIILKKLKIDFAHFQYIVPPIKVCKYIVTTHDVIFHDYPQEFSWKYRFSKHWLYKISAQMADILTTVSEFSKRSMSNFFGIPLEKIHVIPNAVGKEYFNDYNKKESESIIYQKYGIDNYVVVVSRIEPRKNHIMVLRAFLALGLFEKNYNLVFVGKESIIDNQLKEEISCLSPKQKQNFHHIEGISEEDLIHFYNASQFSVYPSKAEGFGIPPLESACLFVPTICSNKSAMEDFVFFGKNHIDPNNLGELIERMKITLFDTINQQELKNIYITVRDKYSWNVSAKKMENLIISI